jgi:hypothetical protein
VTASKLLLTLLAAAALAAIAPPPLAAQPYNKHNFTVGVGAGLPRDDLEPYFVNRPAFNFGYGYRFSRYLQLDAGMQTVFGAGRVRDFIETPLTISRIRDFQFFFPVGGRVIFPVANEKLLIYGGGGGAYMRYSEMIRQPSDFIRIDCPVCAARDGWGYYALAGASVALDARRLFRLGGTTRMYQGHTDGPGLGTLPAIRTKDRWLNISAEFSVTF